MDIESKDLEDEVGGGSVNLPPGMYVEGKTVYEFVAGGSPMVVGFVSKDGIPCENVIGGPPRPITGVFK